MLACFSQCDKGGKTGLSGMKCRVEYGGGVEDGIIEVVDPMKHKVIVYLCRFRRVVAVNVWDLEEVNQKQKR